MIEKPILAPNIPVGVIAKSSATDQSVTSSTTLVDAPSLTFPVAPGETWVATFVLPATFAAAGQIKVAVTAPSGATGIIDAELISPGIVSVRASTASPGTGLSLDSITGTQGVVVVRATIANAAVGGFVTLQFAQKASSATPTTVLANASLTAIRT